MTPSVRERTEQPYVAIGAGAWGPVTELVSQVLGWVQQRDLALAAPPSFATGPIGGQDKRFQLEVGAPIEREVSGDGRMRAGRVPTGFYATVVHVGHPDRIRESLDRLEGGSRTGA